VQRRSIEQSENEEGKLFGPVDSLEIDGERFVTWDEGVEREVDTVFGLAAIFSWPKEFPFAFDEITEQELVRNRKGEIAARIVRQRWPISGRLRVSASRVSQSLAKLRLRVENDHFVDRSLNDRQEALRQSLIATHLLLGAERGKFVSLLEPPEWAAAAASSCENRSHWPVLAGDREERDLLLVAPIILYDHPRVAPESAGDSFDATEIDELLALRTIALTDSEKREAQATDARAAEVLNRIETMPAATFGRLHGAVRDFRPAPAKDETALWVKDVKIAAGSKVRLRPRQSADAQDMFLDGRIGIVNRILRDADAKNYLAVTLADDPAADLLQWHGRFHYFYPEEVEPLEN
jgi:hypothetical protein